jgi:DNA-directed RNA polymerase specialized sigma24 family protein
LYIRTLSEDDWWHLRVAVLAYAERIIHPSARAEVVTQETFMRLFDGRAFDESKIEAFDELSPVAKRQALERRLLGIVKSVVSDEKKLTPRRRAYENRAGLEHNALSETTSPSPESATIEGEERARAAAVATRQYAKLRAKLVGQTLELGVCDGFSEGITKPSELAKRLNCTPEEIYVAIRRIKRLMANVVAAERGEAHEEESP